MTTTPMLQAHLRPGDTVLVGQANGEPPGLVEQLIAASSQVEGLTAYCGYTLGDAWAQLPPGQMAVRGFIAHGAMRGLSRRGLFDPLPWHISAMAENIERGSLPVDVVLLQVGPADADGYFAFGPQADYVAAAVPRARAVVVEVNERMPRVTTRLRLHRSQVSACLDGDAALLQMPKRPPQPEEVAVAANIAELVGDGAALQLGLGPLADALVSGLKGRRGVRVISGMAGDWLVDLADAGALADEPDAALVGLGLGTQRFYDFVADEPRVRFAPTDELVEAARTRELIAVNSALEVDLSAQVNAEEIAGKLVGGIGGQVDFLRAARGSQGGLGVVALASRQPDGSSRIVERLTGPVTTARSDVDLIVTEYGVADLRAASIAQRRERLAAIAAPEFRDDLRCR